MCMHAQSFTQFPIWNAHVTNINCTTNFSWLFWWLRMWWLHIGMTFWFLVLLVGHYFLFHSDSMNLPICELEKIPNLRGRANRGQTSYANNRIFLLCNHLLAFRNKNGRFLTLSLFNYHKTIVYHISSNFIYIINSSSPWWDVEIRLHGICMKAYYNAEKGFFFIFKRLIHVIIQALIE